MVLLVVGTALGVAAGIAEGQWTTAATGFASLAGADLLWTHQYARPRPGRGRRALSLGALALAVLGLVAPFVAAPSAQRVGLALMGAGMVLCVGFVVGNRRRSSPS